MVDQCASLCIAKVTKDIVSCDFLTNYVLFAVGGVLSPLESPIDFLRGAFGPR